MITASQPRFRMSLILAAAAFAVSSVAQAQAPESHGSGTHSHAARTGSGTEKPNPGASKFVDNMHHSMQSMADVKLTGDVDRDFASRMKMHAEHSVAMAQIEMEHGKSPALKAIARKVIEERTREIKTLQAWLNQAR